MTENNDIKIGKKSAIISYFYLIGVLIAYFTNLEEKSSFAYFHIRQSLGLWLSFMALGYPIGYFDNWQITFSFWVAFGILFIYGFSSALSGKMIPIPLFGKIYQKVFTKIQ
ncbi:MAG: hypothetical protein HON66_03375 [Formosa sp.]|jgi:uncharacterized membrane protein|nr:hypothetical protein [Formosa sp.]MDC3351111.1 hypothetical protein [Flavobacteriaceae bacterium]|tara:strand:+ start:1167 stop:1499 length:333 start_codon:yes stop_codon:yes gene_type:complete